MGVGGLVTQGARASAAMILTQLHQDDSLPARFKFEQLWFNPPSDETDLFRKNSASAMAAGALPPSVTRTPTAVVSWWRHQMEASSALLTLCVGNSPVTDEFPAQRPVTQSFDDSFDLRPNKQLSKQSWGWWFLRRHRALLWRHCNVCHARYTGSCLPCICSPDQHGHILMHYNDVIMGVMASPLFAQLFVQAQIKENVKAPFHWPLRGEFL